MSDAVRVIGMLALPSPVQPVGYVTDLRSITQGRGSASMRIFGYEVVKS